MRYVANRLIILNQWIDPDEATATLHFRILCVRKVKLRGVKREEADEFLNQTFAKNAEWVTALKCLCVRAFRGNLPRVHIRSGGWEPDFCEGLMKARSLWMICVRIAFFRFLASFASNSLHFSALLACLDRIFVENVFLKALSIHANLT